MKQFALLLFVCLLWLPASGQKTAQPSSKGASTKKVSITPADERLREALKNDQTVLALGCGHFDAINPRAPFSESQLRVQRENSRIRLMLYEASRAADKTVRVKMQCSNIGGNEAPLYMLVENGKIKYMGDYVPDGRGGLRLDSVYCDRLNVGTFAARPDDGILEFTPLAPANYADKVLILQCQTGSRAFIF